MKPRLRTKLSLALAGAFAFLVLLEASLRLGGYLTRSAQEYRNSQSLRQKGSCRILCLGESTTAGQYPAYLEKTLNQRRTGLTFSVIDKGVNGTNSSIIVSRLELNLALYRPDIVVAMMGSNDQGILYYKDIPAAKTPLFYYSKAYRLIRILWARLLATARQAPTPQEARAPGPHASQASEAYRQLCQDEDSLKKAVEKDPQDSRAYVALGQFYRVQTKLAEAEGLFKQAIALQPQSDYAYAALGRLYRDQDKLPEAEAAFRKAVELNPKNSRAYTELGGLYRDQGKLPEAEGLLKQIITLKPQNDHPYAELGWLYQAQGKLPEAEDAFRKAVERNPKNIRAYSELWGFCQSQGRLVQLQELCTQAIALNPQDYRAYAALSVLYEETGRPALAREYAQKANSIRSQYCVPLTVTNYRALKEALDKQGI
ncbi:MAG TPA: tetratricopeptide repeat protein, partial [Patescibacteria group bacterium]|nr:tetratricopeptide repeat protein [Patescibacteria group bacterium]